MTATRTTALLGISGIATWFPVQSRSAADEVAAGRLTEEEAEGHSGVKVFFAEDHESPVFMAVEAGRAALAKSGVQPESLSRLYYGWTNYQGNDYFTASHAVADGVGVPRTCVPVGVQQACNGSAAGLSLAADSVVARPDTYCVVIMSDRFGGPGIDHYRSHRALAHGDGAVATVVGPPKADDLLHVLSLEQVAGAELWKTRDGDEGFVRPAQHLPDFIVTTPTAKFGREGGRDLLAAVSHDCLDLAIDRALDAAGIEESDPRIKRVMLPRLGGKVRDMLVGAAYRFDADLLECHYSETGHLGAGDIIANLEILVNDPDLKSGDLAVMIGAGGGYTYSCAVVEFP